MKIIDTFLKEGKIKDFKKRNSVKAFVFNEDNDLLILRRQNDDAGAGQWDLPGGCIELNENQEDALQREVKEETNLRIENIKKLKIVTLKIPEDGVDSDMNLYRCDAKSLDVILKPAPWRKDGSPEHTEYRWVSSKDEMMTLPMLPLLKTEIMKLLK
jgi:8-oxo-dGTP diphosphatase